MKPKLSSSGALDARRNVPHSTSTSSSNNNHHSNTISTHPSSSAVLLRSTRTSSTGGCEGLLLPLQREGEPPLSHSSPRVRAAPPSEESSNTPSRNGWWTPVLIPVALLLVFFFVYFGSLAYSYWKRRKLRDARRREREEALAAQGDNAEDGETADGVIYYHNRGEFIIVDAGGVLRVQDATPYHSLVSVGPSGTRVPFLPAVPLEILPDPAPHNGGESSTNEVGGGGAGHSVTSLLHNPQFLPFHESTPYGAGAYCRAGAGQAVLSSSVNDGVQEGEEPGEEEDAVVTVISNTANTINRSGVEGEKPQNKGSDGVRGGDGVLQHTVSSSASSFTPCHYRSDEVKEGGGGGLDVATTLVATTLPGPGQASYNPFLRRDNNYTSNSSGVAMMPPSSSSASFSLRPARSGAAAFLQGIRSSDTNTEVQNTRGSAAPLRRPVVIIPRWGGHLGGVSSPDWDGEEAAVLSARDPSMTGESTSSSGAEPAIRHLRAASNTRSPRGPPPTSPTPTVEEGGNSVNPFNSTEL